MEPQPIQNPVANSKLRTIILPGASIKNKVWAEETKGLLIPRLNAEVFYWNHWDHPETKDESWTASETSRIIDFISNDTVNILAKSVGTLITMYLIQQIPEKLNKIILCGIPLLDLSGEDKATYQALGGLLSDKVLCLQNENDNHGSYQDAQEFIKNINPEINILSKPRSDHEYPYLNDFLGFVDS